MILKKQAVPGSLGSYLITLILRVGASYVIYQNLLLGKQECSNLLCVIICELKLGLFLLRWQMKSLFLYSSEMSSWQGKEKKWMHHEMKMA